MSEASLNARMAQLGIRHVGLVETFARSGGPSGISVTVQDSRSQAQNRRLARERLLDAVEHSQKEKRAEEIARREKARRRRSPRPRALKQRILESKRKRSELKRQRTKIEM